MKVKNDTITSAGYIWLNGKIDNSIITVSYILL